MHRGSNRSGGRDKADLADALDAVGRVGLRGFDEDHVDVRHVFRPNDIEAAKRLVGGASVVVAWEAFAHRVADRVVFMEGGQIIEEGSPDVILRSPSTKRLQFFLEKLNITAFKPKSDVVTQQTMKSDLRM